jgi:peptide/nickel transport system permease protein
MFGFILRRLANMLLTMLIVSVLVFFVAEIAPGNIARNILGAFVTPEQEASFNAQLGMDRPAVIRYLSWLLGSDWTAEKYIGLPLAVLQDPRNGSNDWWAVDADGTLVRWRLDGDDLICIHRLPTGEHLETINNERWQASSDGASTFWGVDTENHAVLWERGGRLVTWTRGMGAGIMVPETGGGRRYIPLQRGLLRGDPGISIRTGQSVASTLPGRLRNSVILAGLSFGIVMPLALLLGVLAGVRPGSVQDRVITLGGLVTAATPEFTSAMFLILIFSAWLGVLPGATVFLSDRSLLDQPEMLVLPILTLCFAELGYVSRITRSSMVEVMNKGYIRTAILKGLPYRTVVFKHAARNALMTPITVIMLHVNWLLGGIVVVETIFGFPGLGKYITEAALFKDVNAIEAGAMVLVLLAVGTQLVADIAYTFINPRVRYA